MRGAKGDPYLSHTKFADILKQKQIGVPSPKFIRDAMFIDDIAGTKAKDRYFKSPINKSQKTLFI